MKYYSSGFSLILLIVFTSHTGGFSDSHMKVNYFDFVNPGKWYFIPGGVDPPWQLHILNNLIYNESTPYPAKIMLGQSTPMGASLRLDLGFYRKFVLQVQINPENDDSQISQIQWSANLTTIIVLSESYLSISDGSVKHLKAPFTEFRVDFLIFWSAKEVLLDGELYIGWSNYEKPINSILKAIYNLYDGIRRISAVDFAVFIVILLITYKGWMVLLEQLGKKR